GRREFRMGRRLPYPQPSRTDARDGVARALAPRVAPRPGESRRALPCPRLGRRAPVGHALHVERNRHRLQSQPQPATRAVADLWNSSLKGRMTMLDDPEDMLGACLKKLGLPFSATDPVQLARAEREAIAQKPLLRAYLNAEVRDQLVAGDVLAAQLWSTTAQQ